ncbi:CubicO group peptidase, beta-lactamase class C family [Parapedobacter composti]|uniref:CubicO group peptidase, beta-lactamase class C family n=1 Tax=Parapedobacter composti TaxID=623281 RepID=A0A1I1L121_9SPHI|nr:serine hydrolase domain-containing protein [Parapedobacter composti]SFC66759.1 CubicO group peptidase, beta-lactamase class C family [Parapedobacter composti]
MIMKREWCSLLLIFCFYNGCWAQFSLSRGGVARLDSVLRRDMGKPGVVLAISSGNELIYEKAMGLASLEWNTPMTSDAVFEAGSVSKQFTAATVLKLIEQKRLSLDDDVRKYVPELPDYGEEITIRHLLTMTSGLRDWRNITYLMGKATFACAYSQSDALEIICRQRELNFAPGTKYSYSNSNYDLLSIIVYRITKEPFVKFSTREVLDPVGFMHAKWRDNALEVVTKKVDSYRFSEAANRYFTQDLLERTHGAAGMLVTAADLIKWSNHWASGKFGETLGKLRETRGRLIDGSEIAYAYGGVRVTNLGRLREVTHSGLVAGYRAWLAYYPEAEVSVACLTNDRSFEIAKVRNIIGELLTGERLAEPKSLVAMSPSQLADLRGIYKGVDHFQCFEIKTDGAVAVIGKDTLGAIAKDTLVSGHTTYILKPEGTIAVHAADEVREYKKVNAYNPTEKDLKALEGRYVNDELSLDLELKVKDGKLVAYRKAHDSMTLNPTYEDGHEAGFYTLSNGLRALFAFTRSRDGHMGLTVSIPRAEHFSFTKH